MAYFALELLEGEVPKGVAELICREGSRLGLRFKYLELQGDIPLLGKVFIRFKSDLPDPSSLLRTLFSTGRGVIEPYGTGYRIRTDTREAPIDSNRMHMAPLPGKYRKLRGTAHPLWGNQFG